MSHGSRENRGKSGKLTEEDLHLQPGLERIRKGETAGEEDVEEDAEGPDVLCGVGHGVLLGQEQLWCGVGEGAGLDDVGGRGRGTDGRRGCGFAVVVVAGWLYAEASVEGGIDDDDDGLLLAIIMIVEMIVVIVRGADGEGHTEIADLAYSHLVDEDVLGLDVPMDHRRDLVEVSEATDDLSEHHADLLLGERGVAVALEDVEEGAGGAEEGEEVVGVRGVHDGEEREDVLVAEGGPDVGLAVETFASEGGVVLAVEVGVADDLEGDGAA